MIAEGTAAKIIGILAGSILALVFLPPKTIKGFMQRLASAIIFGAVAGAPLRIHYLGWDEDFDSIIGAFALASFCSWWAMGTIKGVSEKIFPKKIED